MLTFPTLEASKLIEMNSRFAGRDAPDSKGLGAPQAALVVRLAAWGSVAGRLDQAALLQVLICLPDDLLDGARDRPYQLHAHLARTANRNHLRQQDGARLGPSRAPKRPIRKWRPVLPLRPLDEELQGDSTTTIATQLDQSVLGTPQPAASGMVELRWVAQVEAEEIVPQRR